MARGSDDLIRPRRFARTAHRIAFSGAKFVARKPLSQPNLLINDARTQALAGRDFRGQKRRVKQK
jgi:hypothetical protein